MLIHVVQVITDSSDTYIWAYRNKPSHEQVIRRLYDTERAMDFHWYLDTTSIRYYETELELAH